MKDFGSIDFFCVCVCVCVRARARVRVGLRAAVRETFSVLCSFL